MNITELLDQPLTPEEVAVARKAVTRWGKTNPSFVDVIDTITPSYASQTFKRGSWVLNREPCDDVLQVARWRRVKDYALRAYYARDVPPGERYCRAPGCTNTIPNDKKAQVYCSKRCGSTSKKRVPPKTQTCDCGRQMTMRSKMCKVCAGRVKDLPACALAGCDKPVKRHRNTFCSNDCRAKSAAGLAAPGTCAVCHQPTRRLDALTCSLRCADVRRRNRLEGGHTQEVA